MTREQFNARFCWTVDPETGCWTDLQGESVISDPRGCPARVTIRRHEGAPPGSHGTGTYMQRANRLAYETFVGPAVDPPHAMCGNRACFNPEHLEPKVFGSWRRTPAVTCQKCGKRVPREQAIGLSRHYACKIHGEERARKREERRAQRAAYRAAHPPRPRIKLPESMDELRASVRWDVSDSGCWVNATGHGVRLVRETGYYAINRGCTHSGLHRLVFSLSEGRTLERGEQVCHRCDNPGCINPGHLFAGTRSDNTQDARAKGRLVGVGQKITPDQVVAIIESTASSYELAPVYGLTPTQIRRIKAGKRWRGVYDAWRARHAAA